MHVPNKADSTKIVTGVEHSKELFTGIKRNFFYIYILYICTYPTPSWQLFD